jgi:hypothetical protein
MIKVPAIGFDPEQLDAAQTCAAWDYGTLSEQ